MNEREYRGQCGDSNLPGKEPDKLHGPLDAVGVDPMLYVDLMSTKASLLTALGHYMNEWLHSTYQQQVLCTSHSG